MAEDSAWRQWRGAMRDLENARTKAKQTRDIWLQNLLGHFEVRRAAARERGEDTTEPTVLWAIGVPCAHCLTIAGAQSGHKLVVGGANSWPYWAECGAKAIDPKTAAMPVWPS